MCPVNFPALLAHIRAVYPSTNIEQDPEDPTRQIVVPLPIVSGKGLKEAMEASLNTEFFGHGPSDSEKLRLTEFVKGLSARVDKEWDQWGLDTEAITCVPTATSIRYTYAGAEEGMPEWEREVPNDVAPALLEVVTQQQMRELCKTCRHKYGLARLEAGSVCGALAAQSIGEPATQMTLKTFHFAGVASMNVTLGVPRLKEIINAVERISTPVMSVQLLGAGIEAARFVKGRLERTLLGEVCTYIREVFDPSLARVELQLDMKTLASLQLDLTSEDVKRAILKHPKINLKPDRISCGRGGEIFIGSPNETREQLFFELQRVKLALPSVVVRGLPSVSRAVINHKTSGEGYELLVEGMGFLEIMGTSGVDAYTTITNNILEISRVLGIEAARQAIINEVSKTMAAHGMSVDLRHFLMLADLMTNTGNVTGITRFGMSKTRDSVLQLASFERTLDHLFAAAYAGTLDNISGVSESIIMGVPIPVGTGTFGLMKQPRVLKDGSLRVPSTKGRTTTLLSDGGVTLDSVWTEDPKGMDLAQVRALALSGGKRAQRGKRGKGKWKGKGKGDKNGKKGKN
ncbi:hypothetical protein KIPB_006415 [Kipferlia bialata]|uniref:DNA-directed RNA polymerase n=1 Tax=Kipferlia bialata TaxID=797122 RepID=A0A9K3CX01_9EUKA|nr:hypothetical protein KIPB_006415 [Kipferlia bialata]|eukprot:g6415.t1